MTWAQFLLFVHVAAAIIWAGGELMMQRSRDRAKGPKARPLRGRGRSDFTPTSA
jgi:hypothetical protein